VLIAWRRCTSDRELAARNEATQVNKHCLSLDQRWPRSLGSLPLEAMRWLIYGPGAVGGALAGGLAAAGEELSLVARGANLEAIAMRGLVLATPEVSEAHRLEVAPSAVAAKHDRPDAVLLCVKSQDSAAALRDLHDAFGASVPIVCAQNGVTNERAASALFERVYGVMVWMPAAHLEPGMVSVYASKPTGVLRVGRFPSGRDELSGELVDALNTAGFEAREVDEIDAWKHAKLLANLGNCIDAFCKPVSREHPFHTALVREAEVVLSAAGLGFVGSGDLLAATSSLHMSRVSGERREGGSTWQSATRGLPNEVEHLNGYVVALGEKHGIPAPYNTAMVQLARSCPEPRSIELDSISLPPG
jgi:2-dehydropantoate 2-reductase